ncbi:MAG: rhodanese-like domain-containing protein [Candidatus Methylophosphatis roskildensis]
MARIADIAAYRFVPLDDRTQLRTRLREAAASRNLLGTILLAPEGINLFLAGEEAGVHAFVDDLRADARFAAIDVKWSGSNTVPFKRLRVRLKNEIVTLRAPDLDLAATPAPYLPAADLARWYDEGCDFVMVDTRNAWEVAEGSFDNAIDPHIASFGEFPHFLDRIEALKDKTIVTFCTGGIRCEKAAPLMKRAGFKDVHQLEGGILRYFEQNGGAHWRGNCVVFDERGALRPDLSPAIQSQ